MCIYNIGRKRLLVWHDAGPVYVHDHKLTIRHDDIIPVLIEITKSTHIDLKEIKKEEY